MVGEITPSFANLLNDLSSSFVSEYSVSTDAGNFGKSLPFLELLEFTGDRHENSRIAIRKRQVAFDHCPEFAIRQRVLGLQKQLTDCENVVASTTPASRYFIDKGLSKRRAHAGGGAFFAPMPRVRSNKSPNRRSAIRG